MIKAGRKPSSDPVQEKLRQSKAVWNKEVSTFVNDLIHYKKLMNGWPNKFHMEKSFIKDPVPADPATIIGSLVSDFNDIATKSNALIKQQLEYSKARKKRQMKQMNLPLGAPAPKAEPAAPALDLSQQLSLPLAASFEEKYGLVAEGSSKISRFFTRLFNPSVGFSDAANLRRARMAMLNACADTYRNLGKFQVQVVKSSKDSIPASHQKLNEAWSNWTLVSRAYTIFKSSKSVGAPDKGGTIENDISEQDLKEEKALENLDKSVKDFETKSKKYVPAPLEEAVEKEEEQAGAQPVPMPWAGMDISEWPLDRLEKVKKMLADYKKYRNNLPGDIDDSGYLMDLDRVTDKFIATRGKKLHGEYEQFYDKSIQYINEKIGSNAKSFKDIISFLTARAKANAMKPVQPPVLPTPPVPPANVSEKTASFQIEKVSQDFLKRWVGKTIHQLSLFDKTSPHRLSSYKLAGELRKEINVIMDLLEKGLDENTLGPAIKDANSKMVSLRGMMRSLYLSSGK